MWKVAHLTVVNFQKVVSADKEDSTSEDLIVGEQPRAEPPGPPKFQKKDVPIWKKKGPLTMLEREKIDSMVMVFLKSCTSFLVWFPQIHISCIVWAHILA